MTAPGLERVLVTGASGFIGRNLVRRLLDRGVAVTALVRPTNASRVLDGGRVRVVEGEVEDARAVLDACCGASRVVHLAAMMSVEGTDYHDAFRVNVAGTKNVLDAARAAGVRRFVTLGTQSENSGAYARTKREADELLLASDVPHVVLRPSLVYGRDAGGLFGSIAAAVKRLPVVPVIGSGNYPMNPVHVDDVCSAIVAALEASEPLPVYYLSGPRRVTFRAFLSAVARAQGKSARAVSIPYLPVAAGIRAAEALWLPLPVTSDTLSGLVNPRLHDSLAAERDLGFNPRPLEQGLRESLA